MSSSKDKLLAFFTLVWSWIKRYCRKAWNWYAGLYRGARWYKKLAVPKRLAKRSGAKI